MAAVLAILGLICSLGSFVCGVIVLIHAFQDEVLQGILCLCVPFYILYYAFARFEHAQKPAILGGWLGLGLLSFVLQLAIAAVAGA